MGRSKGEATKAVRVLESDLKVLQLFNEDGGPFGAVLHQFLKTWIRGSAEARGFLQERAKGDAAILAFLKEVKGK